MAREVLRVAPADAPMQVAVLVDNSEAARDAVPDIRRALPDFVDAMTAAAATGGKNDLSIVTLAERPTIVTDYTADRAQLQKGIGRIFAQSRSASYLLEAIIEVSRGFKKREAQRPVIVAIAVEGPEYSSRYFEQVLEPLHDAGAAFHAIVLGPPSHDISDDAHNRNVVLAEGTRTTGGRYDNLLASSALPAAMKRVAAELTHQYPITYARPQSLIPPDKVTVSAARSGMTARGTLDQGSARTRTTVMTRFKACAVILAVGVMATAIRIIAAPVPQAPGPAAAAARTTGADRPGPGVPRGRRARVAQRDGDRRHRAIRHRPADRRLQRVRRRRQTGRHLLQPHPLADRAVAAARHERQHGIQAAHRAGSGDRLRAPAPAAGPRRGRRLRQSRRRPAELYEQRRPISRRRFTRPRRADRRLSTTPSTSR